MLMKKIIFSGPIGRKHRRVPYDLRKNILFAVFMLTLFAGIAAGAFGGRDADKETLEKLDLIFLTNFSVRCSQGMINAFVASFASAFLFLLVIFLMGLSLWGGAVTALIPFIKGYGYGISIGYLYCAYGFMGILYNLLIILPGAFFCSVIIAAAAQESFRSSAKFIALYRPAAVTDDPHIHIRKYMLSMLWLLFLAALSSAADMLFSLMFSWIFSF